MYQPECVLMAKRKEQDNLSSLTESSLLIEVNVFLGVAEMVWDKFLPNWGSRELSSTELLLVKPMKPRELR